MARLLLLGAVREREAGESALAAFGRFIGQPRGLLAEKDPDAARSLLAITRMITDSPALLARERQIYERYSLSLAALLAEETGAGPEDVEAWVAANALIGLHRALVEFTRTRLVAGVPPARVAREASDETGRAVRLLEGGLGSYAVR
jgi:hypothetical protein